MLNNKNNTEEKIKKQKPPIPAQILYALGFLGLIFGLFGVFMMLYASTINDVSLFLSLFGLSSINLQLGAIILGLIVIGLFYLINQIRNMKKWALISYSSVFALGYISAIYEYVTMSDLEKIISGRNDALISLLVYTIVAIPLSFIWINHRAKFK